MMRKMLLAVGWSLTLLATAPRAAAQMPETRYDWAPLAREIAAGATDPYRQAYAIYRWLCDHIAYDTSYSIYHADACYEQQRGVCQAYCELFCRLAEPLGLRAEIISGRSKNQRGEVDDQGHAWLFVYTDGQAGILVDPTWGAGSVDGTTFVRNDHEDAWFDVDPYWMIFSHLPDAEHTPFQLLPEPVDEAAFRRMPFCHPAYGRFGQSARQLFEACMSGRMPELPDYYTQHLSQVEVGTLPTDAVLHVGRSYDFAVRRRKPVQLMLNNGSHYYFRSDTEAAGGWFVSAEGYDVCRFMPACEGEVTLSVREGDGWSVVVQYRVAAPTAAEIAALEAALPQRSPAWEGVEYFYEERLREHGADIAQVLRAVKAQHIRRLPLLTDRVKFKVDDIPWNGELRAGETYTFTFSPYEGVQWALINEGDWYREWTQDPVTRAWSITVTPKNRGTLVFGAQMEPNGKYLGCIEYAVK